MLMSFGDSMCAFLLSVLCMSAIAGSQDVCIGAGLANFWLSLGVC